MFNFYFCRLERKYYYTKKNAAKTSPSQYLSLIIDGMDQCKLWSTAKYLDFLEKNGSTVRLMVGHFCKSQLKLRQFCISRYTIDSVCQFLIAFEHLITLKAIPIRSWMNRKNIEVKIFSILFKLMKRIR